ncbi:MAG: NAD(+)/NADH kinase [Patescibacteria group bacterium]
MLKKNLHSIALIGGRQLTGRKNYFMRVVKFLRAQKKEILFEKTVAKILGMKPARDSKIREADLILVFGGDGALLGAVRKFFGSRALFAGVRLDGTLGFLTEYFPANLTKLLAEFFRGKFEVSERMLLEAEVRRGGAAVKILHALNEMVLQQKNLAELIELDFSLDSKKIATFHADGVILATPTGSTAYSLSAGGPILDPSLRACILTPINPHLLTARPLVLPADEKIRSKIRVKNLVLTADGQINFPLKIGDEIVFRKAEWMLQIVHPRNRNHFEILRHKLNWSRRS